MIRNEKGFTLIELMVVVLIIGILVAVAIPLFSSAADNSRDKACIANLRTIGGALAQYSAENGGTAESMDELAQYLKDTDPTDPHGATYHYEIVGGSSSVDLDPAHPNDKDGVAFPNF